MAEKKKRTSTSVAEKRERARNRSIIIVGILLVISLIILYIGTIDARKLSAELSEKLELLEAQIITPEVEASLGEAPAGPVGHVVFISVCDGETRANVYNGTGATLQAAFDAAEKAAGAGVRSKLTAPLWVKVDVIRSAQIAATEELQTALLSSQQNFFRYGIAFDDQYSCALLEEQMSGGKIYDYEQGIITHDYLNSFLTKAGQEEFSSLPEQFILFQCRGWFCGEDDIVYALNSSGSEYGRRAVDLVDADYAKGLVESASKHLVEQVKDDGAFVYGIYPRFDNEVSSYNIVRHAGTIWSLVCRYRILPDEALEETVDKTINYTLGQIRYADDDTAYLYEEKSDEFKLGANGVAVIALTEYMDVFQNERYVDVCRQLGNGILSMLDQETGEYYHVLNGDFSRKEAFRTIYYDGEATFALCRLYSLTGEEKWLDAAKSAVGHFIEADYSQYRDHWVAYSMNEITKHVSDPAYFSFAMENVQKNLERIYTREVTNPTNMELLMVGFETYIRMMEQGVEVPYLNELDLPFFLKTIYSRADCMLDGFFYPEYAMYMENPARILGSFMVRQDGFRMRIDDVQHNIGGYYLYYKHYEDLVAYGMLEYRD